MQPRRAFSTRAHRPRAGRGATDRTAKCDAQNQAVELSTPHNNHDFQSGHWLDGPASAESASDTWNAPSQTNLRDLALKRFARRAAVRRAVGLPTMDRALIHPEALAESS